MKRTPMQRSAPLKRSDGKARLNVAIKTKACRVCKASFTEGRPFVVWCSSDCGVILAIRKRQVADAKREAAERKVDRVKREAIKPRSKWMAEAQAAFNAWVRARDAKEPCISCNRHHQGSYDAGHYLTTGARPELRFDPVNTNKQCVPCNRHLHGNLVLYRAGLIARVGLAEVERLEGPHEPRKYSADDLRAIRNTYRAKVRELKTSCPAFAEEAREHSSEGASS